MRSLSSRLTAIALATLAASTASALPYGFERITDNGNEDVSAQLRLEVTALDSGRVAFRLLNQGLTQSIISSVYFNDSLGLFSSGAVEQVSSGVSFQKEGKGGSNLPGGNPIGFDSHLWFHRASKGGISNDINNTLAASEYAVFSLSLDRLDYSAVTSAIATGALRVGLHVQSIGSRGGSDSFVLSEPDEPRVAVPDNGSNIALAAVALAAIVFAKRRLVQRPRTATESGTESA